MGRLTCVLLDALGTLVALEPPAGHLVAELAARGIRVTPAQAAAAMDAEIAHYRAEHHRADSAAALARLRRECAGVVRDVLGAPAAGVAVEEVEAALVAAVRFAAYPDVVPALRALRADGARLVVVSNWDVSLHDVLARTGLAALLDGALSSAEAGVAKPDPELLRRALLLVGGDPRNAVMVGDGVATDVSAALAAGVEPALVVRGAAPADRVDDAGVAVPAGVAVLAGLGGLPEWVRYRRR